jgi:hypothetical protein
MLPVYCLSYFSELLHRYEQCCHWRLPQIYPFEQLNITESQISNLGAILETHNVGL